MTENPLPLTGETKQVAAVMHELVHVHAADERRGAFLGADEIDRQYQQQAAEDEPGQDFPHRDRRRGDVAGFESGVRHAWLLEMFASQ